MDNLALKLEQSVSVRLDQLILDGEGLSAPDCIVRKRTSGGTRNVASMERYNQICGWIASVQNLLKLLFDGEIFNPYEEQVNVHKIKTLSDHRTSFYHAGSITQVLLSLKKDIDCGLVGQLKDKMQAVIFDDFLDHADFYLKKNRYDCAGVIAGVVFEDTIRKMIKKLNITPTKNDLEQCLISLNRAGVISDLERKKYAIPQHVRTKATHANWEDFDADSVRKTIEATRELIQKHLDG